MEKEEKELNKKRERKTFILGISLIFFLLILGLISIFINFFLVYDRVDRRKIATITTLKDFYNTALIFFHDKNDAFVTSDGAPGFVPNHDVNITGGPMISDGTKVSFTKPLVFRYKDSRISYILKDDGSYEKVKDHWIFNRKAKKD